MTDENTPASETAPAATLPVAAPESPLHAIEADLHALLARVENVEHEIAAEIAADLHAVAAKIQAAL